MKKEYEARTRSGEKVILDASDEALRKYKTTEGVSLRYGMRVRVNCIRKKGTVKGVRHATYLGDCREAVVWVLLDGSPGVTYGDNDFSLLEE